MTSWEDYGIQPPEFDAPVSKLITVSVFPNFFRSPRPGYPAKTVSERVLQEGMDLFKAEGITDIFCLLTDGEYFKYYGKDLVKFYRKNHFTVHRFPIPDFGVPRVTFAYRMARSLDDALREGKKAVVHCSAGMGRTSLAINCLIEWVRFRDNRKITLFDSQTCSQQSFLIQFRHFLRNKK